MRAGLSAALGQRATLAGGTGGSGRTTRGWAELFARRESGGAGLLALAACGGMGRAGLRRSEDVCGRGCALIVGCGPLSENGPRGE